jgi:hypothetical protein
MRRNEILKVANENLKLGDTAPDYYKCEPLLAIRVGGIIWTGRETGMNHRVFYAFCALS